MKRIISGLLVLVLTCFAPAQTITIDWFDAGSSFTANTAELDGSADYLSRSSLTGASDAKAFTFSVWIKSSSDGSTKSIFTIARTSATDYGLIIRRTSGNAIQILGKSQGGTTGLDATTSTTITTASGWVHLYVAIDLTSTSNRHIYFNGTEDTSVTWTTYSSANNLDLAAGRNRIGCDGATTPGERLSATLAEAWFNDTYLDSPGSFRSGSSPADIGATGSTPLGSAPVFYLSRNGSGDSWATDSSGNGNTFTVTGSLGTGTAP